MAVKDREDFYDALDPTIPNTVSRSLKVGDRSFQTVVTQSGKAILDSELQLVQDARQFADSLTNRSQAPSGWVRGQTHHDGYEDYTTIIAPAGFDDAAQPPNTHIDPTHPLGDLLVNSFILPRLTAQVAGTPIVVEYTNTSTEGFNLVTVSAPDQYNPPLTVKRTDFVFLEVWKALVAPSIASQGSVTVGVFGDIHAGDLITIGGHNLTAILVGVPIAGEFKAEVSNDVTATNIATALNLATTWHVKAKAFGSVVELYALIPGAAGDAITLAVTVTHAGSITVSGPNLTGGLNKLNKPDQVSLYRHGNTLSPAATWLADEIIDPVVNQESTQRVQIQYRIRATDSIEAVNYKTSPDGFSTLSGGLSVIYAQGGQAAPVARYPFVPANRTTILMDSSAVAYDIEDPGLWIAGDGTSTAAVNLNTLDGYVYAIPICFVHRHNDASTASTGFIPSTNANGAPLHDHAGYVGITAVPAETSDRPDGHFADVVDQDNLLDLRRHIIFPGIDTAAELQYQIHSLLDGSLRTWSVDTADKEILGAGSGDVSTRFLVCNEIGRSSITHGGIVTTRGNFIREFDHIARRFGDQSVVERFVMAFYPGDRVVGPVVAPGQINAGKFVDKAAGGDPARWFEDDRLRLDLSLLDGTTLGCLFQGLAWAPSVAGGIKISTLIPAGTVITDVLSIKHDDGNSTVPAGISQDVQVKNIFGLGTTCIDIILDSNPLVADSGGIVPPDVHPLVDTGFGVDGSPRRIFVEFELTYPIGEGTTDTVYHEMVPAPTVYDFSNGVGPGPVIADPDNSNQPDDMEVLIAPEFREGYREVQLEYIANDTTAVGFPQPGSPVGSINDEFVVSYDKNTVYFPRRIYHDWSSSRVYDTLAAAPVGIDDTLTEWGSSSRKVVTSDQLTAAQTLCQITYFPQDAIPNYGPRGYQLGVYFRTHAPQTAGISNVAPLAGSVIPNILHVEPLYMGPDVWTNQIGSGNQDRGFPYLFPGDQIPMNDGLTHYEWFFCATAQVTISDFDADTGLIALRPFVQADSQNVLEFGGAAVGEVPINDLEFRTMYPFAKDDLYRPTVLSQPLFGAVRHKVLFPFLARAVEESPTATGGLLYRKNELLLIVLSRFAEMDDENNVRFTDTANTTCAAMYRTRNLLLVVGDRVTIP